jgi:hypothetical protein
LTFTPEFDVRRLKVPLAISTSQMFGLPEREEKKAIFFLSGDQFGWKSPPRPVVSCRVVESANMYRQMFMSPARERIMVLLDVATGLRQSELFALKWKDIDFKNKQLWVTRSIVHQVVGICKTEASQKPVPLHDHLIRALKRWHRTTPYRTLESWVFASPQKRGKGPYWGQQLLRHHIRPAAQKLGIAKCIGWHTFRRTYSTLLRATGAELKVMQELMRHSTIRVTLDTYTQAVTTEKRAAQRAVVALLVTKRSKESSLDSRSMSPAPGVWPIPAESACTFLVPFCAYTGMEPFLQVLEKSGGDDGTRTRGLCRDRAAF